MRRLLRGVASSSLPANSILRFDDAHTASAAAEGGFDDEREADFSALSVGGTVSVPGTTGTPARCGEFAGGGFVAEELEQFGAGSDEGDAGALAGAWQGGIFGEEAVAGVDEIDAFFFGERDDAFDIEIGLDGTVAFADEVGFVGFEAMQAKAVFLRIDGDGAQAEFGGGAQDADGDFTTVQGKSFFINL